MKSGIRAITVRSWAKVNLTLDVLDLREDGFHDLESVVQTISLYDTVTIELSGSPGTVSIECDMPDVPAGRNNLAYKAAQLFARTRGITDGIRITIRKRIPAEAGLGGGSSNAAATYSALRFLTEPFAHHPASEGQRRLSAQELAKLGSDVPAFLFPGTSLLMRKGDLLAELDDAPRYWMLVVKPPFGVSTKWAYQRLDEIRAGHYVKRERGSPTTRMMECIDAGNRHLLPGLLSNDLEAPVMESFPELGELKSELIEAGAKGALMCGSGSAVFGLFDTEEEALNAERTFSGRNVQTFAARTLTRLEASEIVVQ